MCTARLFSCLILETWQARQTVSGKKHGNQQEKVEVSAAKWMHVSAAWGKATVRSCQSCGKICHARSSKVATNRSIHLFHCSAAVFGCFPGCCRFICWQSWTETVEGTSMLVIDLFVSIEMSTAATQMWYATCRAADACRSMYCTSAQLQNVLGRWDNVLCWLLLHMKYSTAVKTWELQMPATASHAIHNANKQCSAGYESCLRCCYLYLLLEQWQLYCASQHRN